MEQSTNTSAPDLVLDPDALSAAFLRLDRGADSYPSASARRAAELLAATLRAILSERRVPYCPGEGVGILAAKALQSLGQAPAAVPDGARGASDMRALLAKLARIPGDVANLGPLYGSGLRSDLRRP